MTQAGLTQIQNWLKQHPGIFGHHHEAKDLIVTELYSQKTLRFRSKDLERIEEKTDTLNPALTYLLVACNDGRQLVLSRQGFAFPPDLSNSGPLTLPSQVYCLQDFNNLFHQLKHLASEEDRRKEALDLILLLIAILDGAQRAGLEVGEEAREVDAILSRLEAGQVLPPPH